MTKEVWKKPIIEKLKVSRTMTGNGSGTETTQHPHKSVQIS